jgi:predicted nucleic acid-binding Zn ribbon protein
MSARKCPVCGSPLTGRIDKKYCSDQCRHISNNKIKHATQRTAMEINKTLGKNRSILKKLCPTGKTSVRKELLVAMGYDVTVFSSLFLTNRKNVYYLCYDYGFTPLIERGIEKALIVTRQSYMSHTCHSGIPGNM